MERIFSFGERLNVPFNSADASLNGTFNLSPHENILTIALINIHYLYTGQHCWWLCGVPYFAYLSLHVPSRMHFPLQVHLGLGKPGNSLFISLYLRILSSSLRFWLKLKTSLMICSFGGSLQTVRIQSPQLVHTLYTHCLVEAVSCSTYVVEKWSFISHKNSIFIVLMQQLIFCTYQTFQLYYTVLKTIFKMA